MTPSDQMYSWSALKNDWILRRPPIEGEKCLRLGSYGDASTMYKEFCQNTKGISQKEAEELCSSMAKDIVLSVKDAIKMLQNMKPTDNIKLTILDNV